MTEGKNGKKKSGHVVRRIVPACLAALVLWTIWGNAALTEEHFSIESDQVLRSFSGFRIAQVSDLHNAQFAEGNERLLEMLREGEPDIIAITGDLVDSRHTDIPAALDFARKAAMIAPVYYVTGNHEAALAQYGELKAGLEKAGVIVLEDEAAQLERGGERIRLIGLSDPDFTLPEDLWGEVPAMVLSKLQDLAAAPQEYTVVLCHRPELFETYVQAGADLVLSGHAHGGQFRLPLMGGIIAPDQGLFPEYDAGVFTEGGTAMVVSRGLGSSVIPLRFNNPPEVVFVELKRP